MVNQEFSQKEQSDISSFLLSLDSRVRISETRNLLLKERIEVTNRNMIKEYKKTLNEIKDINIEVREIKNDILNIKDTLRRITKELDLFARKENLKILEKYLQVWDPMKFVTQEELKEIIKERGT